MARKIESVLELARHRVGDTVWWVVFRQNIDAPQIAEDDEWMITHHPRILFERGPYKSVWKHSCATAQLPKMHQTDFMLFTNLITSTLLTEEFVICDITRSNETGEFFYSNHNNEWMPEAYLFDSINSARIEQTRLLRMLKKWADKQHG